MRLVFTLFALAGFLAFCSCTEERLTLTVSEEEVASGEQVCVEVRADHFEDILTMQYSIAWDEDKLRFVEVSDFGLPGLSAQNFGRPANHPDRLTISWFEPNLSAVTIPDNAVLYTVCFEAVGESGSSSAVSLTDHPTIVEIANAREEVLSPALIDGSVTIK